MKRLCTVVVALSFAAAGLLGSDTRWARVSTPHFVLSGDASTAELERFAARLESLRSVFTELLPRIHDRSLLPTFVIVFGSDTSFAPFQPPGVTVGGYSLLEPFIPCMVLRPSRADEAFRTIVHEYVHVLFDAPWVPTWLSEGVADYYSMTTVRRDGRRAVVGDRIPAHVAQASRWWVPLTEVLTGPGSSRLSNDDGSESFYAESWLLVHYLMRATPAKGDQIARFVDLLSARVPQAAAFEQAIGPPAKIEAELQRYLGNGIIYGEERNLARQVERVLPKARPMTSAEVDATLGRLLFHLRREGEAIVRLKASTDSDLELPEAAVTLGLMLVRQPTQRLPTPERRNSVSPGCPWRRPGLRCVPNWPRSPAGGRQVRIRRSQGLVRSRRRRAFEPPVNARSDGWGCSMPWTAMTPSSSSACPRAPGLCA